MPGASYFRGCRGQRLSDVRIGGGGPFVSSPAGWLMHLVVMDSEHCCERQFLLMLVADQRCSIEDHIGTCCTRCLEGYILPALDNDQVRVVHGFLWMQNPAKDHMRHEWHSEVAYVCPIPNLG